MKKFLIASAFVAALATAQVAAAEEAIQYQLQTGETVEVMGDVANIVDKDGNKKPVEGDQVLNLADGKELEIKGGKVVEKK